MNPSGAGRLLGPRVGPRVGLLVGPLLLAALALLLHHGALQGGWRNDDPMLLAFAVQHAPGYYFGSRAGLLELSYASISPWAALFFDLGLPLFGVDAVGHYAHMLLVLWATACATALLLKRWLAAPLAWGAGALFLAMPPTGAVAQQLMTGHYAYGLLFSVLALAAFARAVERDRLAWALAAAALYGLATLCKELYVTLPAVLLAWPGLGWRQRLRSVAPVLVVAAGYLALRLWVLGGVGGYAALQSDAAPPLLGGWSGLAALPRSLHAATLGTGAIGWLALAALAAVVADGLRRGRRPNGCLLLAAALALLLPTVPAFLLGATIGYGNDRIAFALGWAVAVLAAWQLQGGRGAPGPVQPALREAAAPAFVAIGVALLACIVAQRAVVERTAVRSDPRQAEYAFIHAAAADQVLVPHAFEGIGYLDRMAQAVESVSGRAPARRVRDEDELAALGPAAGRAAWSWDGGCHCLRRLGAAWDERVRDFARRLQAASGRPLAVEARLDSGGRVKLLQWSVSGQPQRVVLEIRGVGRLPLSARGSFAFGLDTATPLSGSASVRFHVEAADGALQRSGWLSLPLQGRQSAAWSTPAAPGRP